MNLVHGTWYLEGPTCLPAADRNFPGLLPYAVRLTPSALRRVLPVLCSRALSADRLRQALAAVHLVELGLELPGQLLGAGGEGLGVLPGVARLQDLVGDAGAGERDADVEGLVLDELGLVQLAVQHGLDDGAGDMDVHAPAHAVGAAAPAGVDQVDAGLVLLDLLSQQRGVIVGIARHERLAEEAGEGRHRLDDAGLGAGQLGGVAHEEPEHGLIPGKAGDRGQHAVRVGGEKNDRLRVPADTGFLDVGKKTQRIAAP